MEEHRYTNFHRTTYKPPKRKFRLPSIDPFMVLVVALFVVTIGGGITAWLVPQTMSNDTTITVTDKTTKVDNNRSRYLIFDNQDVYEITDAIYIIGSDAGAARFNSSDIYGYMQEGQTYNVHTVGMRVPLLSWYPNIISATKVE